MGDISLRLWLDKPERSVNVFECLHIFREIVEIVREAHSQEIVVHNVRPSCFVMSSFNHVSFIESATYSDSAGSDTLEEAVEIKTPTPTPSHDMHQQRCLGSQDFVSVKTSTASSPDSSCMLSSVVFVTPASLIDDTEENKMKNRRKDEEVSGKRQSFPTKQVLHMEASWYTSPEEVAGAPTSCASDVYQLGVLLFELFCPLISKEEKSRTMSSLRHRVLPPQLLLKWPKEASFCLWLLHPEPNSRPTIGELLQSEFLNEPRDDIELCEAAELRERIDDQELLLDFLMLIQQKKGEAAEKLQHTISFLCSDIEEATKQKTIFKEIMTGTGLGSDNCSTSCFPSITVVKNEDSACLGTRKRVRTDLCVDDTEGCDINIGGDQKNDRSILSKSPRFLNNLKKLESTYFLTRRKSAYSSGKLVVHQSPMATDDRGSVVVTERSCVNKVASKEHCKEGKSLWTNPFLEDLSKYLSFNKLKVKANLKLRDLLQSSNLVCSLSFDRDAEFFATAGVNKKIKIFEYNTTINENRDIHYPVVEMISRSTLSCTCWNTYIKNQIASSNFAGVVQVGQPTRSYYMVRDHHGPYQSHHDTYYGM